MNFKSFKAALGQAVATGTSYAKDLSTQVCAMCLPQWGFVRSTNLLVSGQDVARRCT